MQTGFQYIPAYCKCVSVKLRSGLSSSLTPYLVNCVFIQLALCTPTVHCHAGTDLSLVVPVKGNCNCTAYKGLL